MSGLTSTHAPTPVERAPTPRASWASRATVAVYASIVGIAAVISGLAMGSGNKEMAVLPIAAAVGLALAALACTRYAAFVLLLLGTRSSIDLFKLSGASAGNTATNTAAARGLDPSSLIAMLFLAASVLWLAAQASRGRLHRGSPLRTALLALVAAGAISAIGAEQPQASLLEVLRILSVAMMFVVLEQLISSPEALRRTLVAAYASLAFPLAYTIFGLVMGNPASEVKGSFTRITGPFSQSNTFARYLAFMIVFGLAIYPSLSGRLRWLMGSLMALCTGFLVLTMTRGAILAAVVAVVVVAVVQRRRTLLAGFAVAALVAVVLVPGLGARFATLSAPPQLPGQPETGNSLEWRLNYWTEVLPLANSNPVTGIGLNMTQYQTSAAKQPHNDFIRAYVEAGVVGLGAYTAMHFFLFRNAVTALRRTVRDSFDRNVAVGALGCAVCFLMGSIGANIMSNVVSLWYLVAFSAAGSYIARREPAMGSLPATSMFPTGASLDRPRQSPVP